MGWEKEKDHLNIPLLEKTPIHVHVEFSIAAVGARASQNNSLVNWTVNSPRETIQQFVKIVESH